MALIQYLTQIELDFGALARLGAHCQRAGITRALVVTDAGVRAAGVLQPVLDALGGVAAAVFDAVPSNPTEAAVRAAAALYAEHGCNGLVAVGGGSAIDCAKGVAIAATHPGPLKTYATIEGGSAKITEAAAPLIAVPTTAGTGSEVARGAIVIVDDGRKLGFHSWSLMPKAAICDPALTLGLPPHLTAATGMDAIAHCMEVFMAPAFNPPADGIALEGLRRGWAHIERATRDGSDRDARLNMMAASVHGALGFQKGLGCVHSLSHSLGGADPRLHHGTLNAIFLPAVIRFNGGAAALQQDERMARMGQALALDSAHRTADGIANAVHTMTERLGLPTRLSQVGVTRAMFPAVIEHALLDHCHATNPRLAAPEDYERMLDESF